MSLQIPVLEWTINEVCCWLTANGFQEHTIGFHSNDIDGKALLLMTENDLKLIPIPVGSFYLLIYFLSFY